MLFLYHAIFFLTTLILLTSDVYGQECATDECMKSYVHSHPSYSKIINDQERKIKDHLKLLSQTRTEEAVYQIPLVVHVLENGYTMISDHQIKHTIDYLNDAFRGRGVFTGSPDTKIEFILAQKTTDCQTTTGIVRVNGQQVPGYSTHGLKRKSQQGADEVALKALSKWNNSEYYNIWIVDKIDGTTQSISGFAYYPGASSLVDGMVILASHMTNSKETIIHEMGHAFNLYHTFEGDNGGAKCPSTTNGCGFGWGDCVEDTQPHRRSATKTCLSGFNDCISDAYDEYVYANHMNYYCRSTRFTEGQKQRMRAAIETTSRYHLVNSEGKNKPEFLPESACVPSPKKLDERYGIQQIILKNVNIVSSSSHADNTHYLEHTCMKTSMLDVLETYHLYVSGASSQTHIFGVWIDWNNDGDFEDKGETIVKDKVATNISQHFTVPIHAQLNRKLRIRVMADEYANNKKIFPCQAVDKGQIEDFAVKVTSSNHKKPEIEVYEATEFLQNGHAKVYFTPTNTGSYSEKIIHIYNFGNQDLIFANQAVRIIGSPDFSVSKVLPSTISGSNYATFKIRFTPSSDGNKVAYVEIYSNDSDENPYRFQVESKATTPIISASHATNVIVRSGSTKDFGKQNVGDKSVCEITLKNVGDGKLYFSENNPFKLNHPASFKVLHFNKQTLDVGEKMTFSVEFAPTSETSYTTQLAVFSNASASPYSINFSGQGVHPSMKLLKNNQVISNQDATTHIRGVRVGDHINRVFEIKNTGQGYLKIPNQKISISKPELCQVTQPPSEMIASQQKTAFTLKISPKQIEQEVIRIAIPNNDIQNHPFTFFMTVSGIAPRIEPSYKSSIFDPQTRQLDFGTVILGQSSPKQHIKIKNTGNLVLKIAKVFIAGQHAHDFTLNVTPFNLNPSESKTIEVIFEPKAKHTREATIILESNLPNQHLYSIKIKGRGIPIEPDIEVIGFPHLTGVATFVSRKDQPVSQEFTLKNTGILPLTFNTAFQIQGKNASEFQLIKKPNISTLNPQESVTFELALKRRDDQEKKASIYISSNDPDENPYTFDLYSDLIPPPPPTVEEWLSIPFPEIKVSMQDSIYKLSWWGVYPISDVKFEIYRKSTHDTIPKLIAVTDGFSLRNNIFLDSSKLKAATIYTYSVRAKAQHVFSNTQTVKIITPPALPRLVLSNASCESNSFYFRVAFSEGTREVHWYDSPSSKRPLKDSLGHVIVSDTFRTPILRRSKIYYVAPVGEQFENPKRLAVRADMNTKMQANIFVDSVIQICDNKPFIIQVDTVKGAKYTWYKDGLIYKKNTFMLETKQSGLYVLKIDVSECSSVSDTIKIEFNKPPTIDLEQKDSTMIFCGRGLIRVRKMPMVTYKWYDSKKNFIKLGAEINISKSDTLELRAISQGGCVAYKQIPVIVNSYSVVPKVSVNNPICEGEDVQFSVESVPNATYSWSGNGLKSERQNPTLSYSSELKNDTYFVTINVNDCLMFASVNLKVGSVMDYSISQQDVQCYGAQNGFIKIQSNNESILSYRLGEFGQMQFGKKVIFDSLTAQDYHLILENEEGCQEKHQITIRQPDDFTISVSHDDITISIWDSVQLEAFGARKYRWFPSEGLTNDTVSNPTAHPARTTTYTVVGYDEKGCEHTQKVVVHVLTENEILPNLILSPNGDGLNDVWKIKNIEYFPHLGIEIYTQTGLKVFQQQPYQNNWNGTWNGKELPEGTYFYKIYLPEAHQILKMGDINLVK